MSPNCRPIYPPRNLVSPLSIFHSHWRAVMWSAGTVQYLVIARLLYAASAWHGFKKASDRQRMNLLINRAKLYGYCLPNLPTFEELCDTADDQLFNKKLSCCCDSRSYRVQIRSPHTSARTLQSALGSVGTRIGGRSERHCADWRPYTNAVTCVLGLWCASFFVLRFVAKRCIL